MAKPNRNYGIDLLRIVCMLGIVCLHLLGHGGLLTVSDSAFRVSSLWFWEVLALPAANCFMLISGFCSYRADRQYPKLKNLISLSFTALFYALCIGLPLFPILWLLFPSVASLADLFESLVPLQSYWFYRAYFCTFLLSPFLNLFVQKGDRKMHFLFVLVLAFASCISLATDSFTLSRGYSVFWFLFLYTAGALMKKYDLPGRFSKWIWLLVGAIGFSLTWLPIAGCSLLGNASVTDFSTLFAAYISPTLVLTSVAWVCLFSGIRCKKPVAWTISLLTPSVFSVYLIHEHLLVRKYLFPLFDDLCGQFPLLLLIPFVLVCALHIFLLCILIDLVRRFLFRITRLDKLAEIFARWIRSATLWLFGKFSPRFEA